MKKYLFEIVLGIILAGSVFFGIKSCNTSHKEVKDMTAIGSVIQYDSVKHYRDLWGADHAVVVQQQGDMKALRAFYAKQLDSVKYRAHLKDKQLQDVYDLLAKAEGKVITVVHAIHDTIPGTDTPFTGQYFTWKDGNMHMSGYVDSNKATVFYSMDLRLGVTTYWKRRWFLGKKRYYVDAFSPNKNIHIYGLTGLKIN